jgi:hypothetical protein
VALIDWRSIAERVLRLTTEELQLDLTAGEQQQSTTGDERPHVPPQIDPQNYAEYGDAP